MSNNIDIDKIYNEDCLEGMKRISDKSVSFICCDLPYGTTSSLWDKIIPSDKLWEQYLRILKKQGVVALFGSEPFSTRLRMSKLDWFKYDWIWEKNRPTGFQHAKNMPLKKHEIISIFSPAAMGHANLLGENRMTYNPQGIEVCGKACKRSINKFGNIVGVRPSQKNEGIQEFSNFPTSILKYPKDSDSFHPTQKPLELIKYLIRTYSNEGDLVLDNCMGSGTTAVACIQEKRHFIGFELDRKYFDKALQRIEQQLNIQTIEEL